MLSAYCRQTAAKRSIYSCTQKSSVGPRRFSSTQVQAGGVQDYNTYCRDLVRKRDYDAFLTSQVYPQEHRNGYYALRAFYVELATLQESISNVMIGRMRMQFWRDAVKAFADGRPPQHPIALALYEASQKANLPAYHLKRIIDARDAELQNPIHLTIESLVAHAESTSSTFLYLALSLLGLSASSELSHAASHLGVAQSISTLLRALPYHAAKGTMVIPAEITARHGVSQEEVFRQGGNAKGVEDAVFEFATVANDHLITAREMFKDTDGKVPGPARPVFLSAPLDGFKRNHTSGALSEYRAITSGRVRFIVTSLNHHHLQVTTAICPRRRQTASSRRRESQTCKAYAVSSLRGTLAPQLLISAPPRPIRRRTMLRVDEILQIIINELDDPTSFSLVSKHFYSFTQDPYVRASYFLSRYGPIQALYWALGRGRLMNNKVIDTLLSSGAHLSRYLAQCAMHHYYRTTQVSFIKTPWVRSMSLPVFTHFQLAAVRLYGEIPIGKGDDDASLFDMVIKESRFPADARTVRVETLKEVLQKYKDAMMANFPLVLSIEPCLLPYARANGFHMDHKYRDFVFRKMFEKPAIAFEARTDEIVRNVRELTRLDPRMFLTRTVAAEICLEVKTNEPAYNALKRLDREGALKFRLSGVIDALIKTYANTRSITNPTVYTTLRQLYIDFPSKDRVVRQVLLLQIFLSMSSNPGATFPTAVPSSLERYVDSCKAKIEGTGLGPVTRTDLLEVLSSKFAPEKFEGIVEYGRTALKMSQNELNGLVQEVSFRCLEISCKGKMLKALIGSYPFLEDAIRERVMRIYKLYPEDLPPWQDEAACNAYEAPLCQDYFLPRKMYLDKGTSSLKLSHAMKAEVPTAGQVGSDNDQGSKTDRRARDVDGALAIMSNQEDEDLGIIGQDTLSSMIRKDELAPTRSRRRFYETYANYHESQGRLSYPHDTVPIGTWVRTHFGPRSAVTAIFMLHNVINGTPMTVQANLHHHTENYIPENRVPVTLRHFKMLARLGRTPPSCLFDDIEAGTEFYFGEEDYLTPEELDGAPPKPLAKKRKRIRIATVTQHAVKTESSPGPSTPGTNDVLDVKLMPRRCAATSPNYFVPDSDDDMIVEDGDEDELMQEVHAIVRKRKDESNLQKWIKHLSGLLKEEQKKYSERKKALQAIISPSIKLKVPKTEFHKHLASQLARLRKADKDKRRILYGADCPDQDYSSGEEDEYHERGSRPSKRRKSDIRTKP
ncbi:hypothetical protein NM688_g6761 [Phlebia brevispora]|uniref:Uncharacterized protein n=1 Tax=Phlebia brevispora TaxID=194682 RepID=A0ACC1SCX4_9APHY|nr:hypothetical protein NM688_g6761 [Phlebia brevispora]